MSVAVATSRGSEKLGVDTTQFQEIIAPRADERVSLPRSKMDKTYDSDRNSDEKESKSTRNHDYSSEDSYDDDFEDSERESSSRKSVAKSTPQKSRNKERTKSFTTTLISPRSSKECKTKGNYKMHFSPRSSSPVSSRLPQTKKWGNSKNWKKPKNRSANVKVSRVDHSVIDRVLSANQHKVTKLESRLSQIIKELTKEREENKTLRLIQHRQEKKLEEVIGEEAELPQLLNKHTAETKNLRERLRRMQDASHQKDEKLIVQDRLILKLTDKCNHYKELCERDNLTERDKLQKNLEKTQENLRKKDEEISKLQRMLTLKEKTHIRNLKAQKEKLRQTQDRLQLLEENCINLQDKLRVREKQLDYTNIYHRQIVLKEKNTLSFETPPKVAALPAPKRTKEKDKNETNTDINSKENKTKEMDNKNENNIVKDENEELEKNPKAFLTAQSDKESGSDLDIDKKLKEIDDKMLSITNGINGEGSSKMVNESNELVTLPKEDIEEQKRKEFERSLREEDERLQKEKEEMERKMKELQEKEELEKANREAEWREDSARRAREAEERRLESARRREDERQKEEKRIAEERKREEAERRQAERREQEKKALQTEDSFYEDEEARRKKDALLARLKAIENDKDNDPLSNKRFTPTGGNESSKSHPLKSYEARKADQNLHNGLPAVPRDKVLSPLGVSNVLISSPESVKSGPDGAFDIPPGKPVLIGRGQLAKKNSNQLSWLNDDKKPVPNKSKPKPIDDFNFGDYSPSVGHGSKKPDGSSRRAGNGRRALADNGLNFGDELRSGGRGRFDFSDQRGSGGFDKPKPKNSLGFLDNEFAAKRDWEQVGIPSNESPLLPRRRAAHNGPGVISSVFDDDDIEELTL